MNIIITLFNARVIHHLTYLFIIAGLQWKKPYSNSTIEPQKITMSVFGMGSQRIFSVLMTLLSFLQLTVWAQICDPKTGVCDKHERCSVWKKEGECYRSRSYMEKECPISCKGIAAERSQQQKKISKLSDCQDIHPDCVDWAKEGECDTNSNDLSIFCPKTCGECDVDDGEDDDNDDCKDGHELCEFWASKNECENNPNYMLNNCAKSCKSCLKDTIGDDASSGDIGKNDARDLLERSTDFGERQTANGRDRQNVLERIESTIAYMASDEVKELPGKIVSECKNRNELCTFWQVIGECEKNKSYMQTQCAAACHTCHLIDHERRCPKLENAVPALEPGGMDQMFERILKMAPGNRTSDNPLSEQELQELRANETPDYTVHVHSQPSEDGPWVLTFENFLTEKECDEMVQLGFKYEYKRSEDVGKVKFDGTFDSVQSKGRTSENAWCSEKEGCRDEVVAKRVQNRMAQVISIPPENSEDLQLLKYEKGQFYNTHHDYIGHQRDRQCGPRILTFFLYLSDVEEGGGTNFPDLGITVMPKKGRALLWPSVRNEDPKRQDGRTRHQALPVQEGTKFAANGWIHLFDYLTPQKTGCN